VKGRRGGRIQEEKRKRHHSELFKEWRKLFDYRLRILYPFKEGSPENASRAGKEDGGPQAKFRHRGKDCDFLAGGGKDHQGASSCGYVIDRERAGTKRIACLLRGMYC